MWVARRHGDTRTVVMFLVASFPICGRRAPLSSTNTPPLGNVCTKPVIHDRRAITHDRCCYVHIGLLLSSLRGSRPSAVRVELSVVIRTWVFGVACVHAVNKIQASEANRRPSRKTYAGRGREMGAENGQGISANLGAASALSDVLRVARPVGCWRPRNVEPRRVFPSLGSVCDFGDMKCRRTAYVFSFCLQVACAYLSILE